MVCEEDQSGRGRGPERAQGGSQRRVPGEGLGRGECFGKALKIVELCGEGGEWELLVQICSKHLSRI